jgi:L-threonylcarbamoyladenylate synthase
VEGGDLEAMVEKARELAEEHSRRGLRVSILATDETDSIYDGDWILRSLGSREDLSTIARNLFKCLRELDEMGVDLIIAEGVPMRGLGLAVMNRLRKASGLNIIRDF